MSQVGMPSSRLNLNVDGHQLSLPYYGNLDIDSTHQNVKNVIISLHGEGRNADEHYNIFMNATSTYGVPDSTFIIAPVYLLQEDLEGHNLDSTVLYWPSGDWNAGDYSRNTGTNPRAAQISSFSTMDTLFHRLVQNCPNLETLILTGHSAGSQMVERYAAGGRAQVDIAEQYDIDFRYVSTNVPSFLYMNDVRVVDENAAVYNFDVPELCWTANYYKYGLVGLNNYMEESGVEFIRSQYFEKNVTCLIGQYDTGGQSTNCARDIQGNNRLIRAYVYFGYIGYYYGDMVYTNHWLAELPGVYHEFWGVVSSEGGLKSYFNHGDFNVYVDGPALFNASPLAEAGSDQIAGLQELVVLDGSASTDTDGNITASLWSQLEGNTVRLAAPTSLITSFTTPDQNDSLVFVLSLTDNEGSTSFDTVSIRVNSTSTTSGDVQNPMKRFIISPNPFNSSTTISFEGSYLDLAIDIYDLLGRQVISLAQPEKSKSSTSYRWSGTDQYGFELDGGVYLVQIRSNGVTEIRKVTLLK